jgi:osmotically-inducible protein OsmY
MRRFIFQWALVAIAGLAPALAFAQGPGVAQQIADALRDSGRLQDYNINIKYKQGTAWLEGSVTSPEQMSAAMDVAREVPGVTRVVNEMAVEGDVPADTDDTRPRALELVTGAKRIFMKGSAADTLPAGHEEEDAPLAEEFPAPVIGPAIGPAGGSPRLTRLPFTSPSVEDEVGPSAGLSDQQIANQIARGFKQSGRMRGYKIGVHVQDGVATLQGTVTNQQQLAQALDVAQNSPGVVEVVSRLAVQNTRLAGHERYGEPTPADPPGTFVPSGMGGPLPVAQGVSGGPLPMGMPGMAGGVSPARYDQPAMPNYAWPSYAAHPNYAGVTYPRQYSPTAWPYIGPFYPYPQVPLGWRRVTLEWDDGWWFLDFDDRRCGGCR